MATCTAELDEACLRGTCGMSAVRSDLSSALELAWRWSSCYSGWFLVSSLLPLPLLWLCHHLRHVIRPLFLPRHGFGLSSVVVCVCVCVCCVSICVQCHSIDPYLPSPHSPLSFVYFLLLAGLNQTVHCVFCACLWYVHLVKLFREEDWKSIQSI